MIKSEDEIAEIPAQTVEGLAIKLWLIIRDGGINFDDDEPPLGRSMLRMPRDLYLVRRASMSPIRRGGAGPDRFALSSNRSGSGPSNRRSSAAGSTENRIWRADRGARNAGQPRAPGGGVKSAPPSKRFFSCP